jgi:hypothetical protein
MWQVSGDWQVSPRLRFVTTCFSKSSLIAA